MTSGYETWVGRRYVRARGGDGFVSLISTISMSGIAIAVAVLIVVLSVVNGFERELQERLLTMTAHATIEGQDDGLQDWEIWAEVAAGSEDVEAVAPFIRGQGLLTFGEALSGAQICVVSNRNWRQAFPALTRSWSTETWRC